MSINRFPDAEIMQQAREIAAQCWCDPETSGIALDDRLAEAFARRLYDWIYTARQYASNADYWRDAAQEVRPV